MTKEELNTHYSVFHLNELNKEIKKNTTLLNKLQQELFETQMHTKYYKLHAALLKEQLSDPKEIEEMLKHD